MEGDVVTLSDVFAYDYHATGDSSAPGAGAIRPTGIRPKFSERLAERNITLDPALFEANPAGGTRS